MTETGGKIQMMIMILILYHPVRVRVMIVGKGKKLTRKFRRTKAADFHIVQGGLYD